jgi:plasmid stabilization system protein ParE
MSPPIVLRPEAQRDLLEARDWYEQQCPRLGDAFAERVEEMFGRIQEMPELYAVVLGDVRRSKLRRFPYVVYYRLLSDRIEVIGVLHGSRDPKVWQERT